MVSRECVSRESNATRLLLSRRCKSVYNIILETCLYVVSVLYFQIRNVQTQNCLDTMGHKSGENVGISYCHELGGNQVFAYTKRQQIMSDDNCLDAANPAGPVKLVRCHGMGGNQAWIYDTFVCLQDSIHFTRLDFN